MNLEKMRSLIEGILLLALPNIRATREDMLRQGIYLSDELMDADDAKQLTESLLYVFSNYNSGREIDLGNVLEFWKSRLIKRFEVE